jgi:hypothetical protein
MKTVVREEPIILVALVVAEGYIPAQLAAQAN